MDDQTPPNPPSPPAPAGAEAAEVAIRLRGITNRFGPQVIHEDLDLDVYRGEILGVVGASGSGKSVLLRTIIGLQQPAAGSVEIFGRDRLTLNADEERTARRNWGVLFQDGALFSSLTVAQNIQVPLREYFDLSQDLLDQIASYKLAMVGLSPEAGPKYPSELSGGMRKRAGLARALALDPEILLLDEPTAGLDPIGAANFDQLLADLSRALELTVFLVTHDLDTLHTVCDRVAVLAERRVLAVGTLAELLQFDHPWVRDYFRGPRARAAGITIA
ncbi:ABC transporter ATP-binding protein [Rhodothalassium salexigens]|uniref:ABC transporter ATP-binding protein n=1 Tax=Rhodothalassium salexigens TaxID=1086 RepID=UPI0019117610|nr:ABC transporter ATP-binding protein [Rhodothalassium salexigens]MBK5909979.1 ABC transporter ATP-binding protein [Rhodothalassium salexigens]MBK5921613.1 ABC transporter ATP-binding protein [Rhodothalassium salexigens]